MAAKVPDRAVVRDVAVAALTAAVMVVTDAALGGVTSTNQVTLEEDVCNTRRRLKDVMLTCTALEETPRSVETFVCSAARTAVAPETAAPEAADGTLATIVMRIAAARVCVAVTEAVADAAPARADVETAAVGDGVADAVTVDVSEAVIVVVAVFEGDAPKVSDAVLVAVFVAVPERVPVTEGVPVRVFVDDTGDADDDAETGEGLGLGLTSPQAPVQAGQPTLGTGWLGALYSMIDDRLLSP